ncbi:MAG: Hsp20/alpha crystallin family protein [Candidatus Thiodiazotropha sp.]
MSKIIRLSGAVFSVLLALTAQAQPPAGYYGGGPSMGSPSVERGAGFSQQRGIRFQQDQDAAGYHLRIYTQGYEPGAIDVRVEGPYLVVQNQESHRLENRSERGYSFSSNAISMKRRFRIPRDADVAGMSREESEGSLVVTLPYRR